MLHDAVRERSALINAIDKAGGEKKLIVKLRALLLLDPADTPRPFAHGSDGGITRKDLRKMAAELAKGSNKYLNRSETLTAALATPATQRGRLIR